MADGNLSLSLSNKGTPSSFSLKQLNTSKLINNTFGTQGFKANAKNVSNVNSQQIGNLTNAAKVEPPASGEKKAPLHDIVYSSTPSPTLVNDILGKSHILERVGKRRWHGIFLMV